MGDKPDTKKEKALMVVDYLAPKQKPPALTVGKQYEVAGTLRDQLADRASAPRTACSSSTA